MIFGRERERRGKSRRDQRAETERAAGTGNFFIFYFFSDAISYWAIAGQQESPVVVAEL